MHKLRAFSLLLLLSVVLYGSHLFDGFLSDDYLYLSWAAEGTSHLLAKVTFDSYPRMIRPWPAIPWAIAAGQTGMLLHAVAILLHAAIAFLIAQIIFQRTQQQWHAYLFAALFVAFPLFAEPVLWLSASFDLWATFFALTTIVIWQSDLSANARMIIGSSAFALALLSKESIVLLPLILLLLLPRDRQRAAFLCTGSLVAVYLLVRFGIFHGLGGYADAGGRTIAAGFHPMEFIRAVGFQLPYRILVPLKRSGQWMPLLAILSVGMLVLLAWGTGVYRSMKQTACAIIAFLLAVAPAAPIFHIEADHEGTRLLYFPLAIFLSIMVGRDLNPRKTAMLLCSVVIAFWSSIAIINGHSWSQAAHYHDAALQAMRSKSDSFPTNATVMVDAYDTFHGAYVFRNGLPQAATFHRLRGDVQWQRGTVAQLGGINAQQLGTTIFEIGYDAQNQPIDWTACQRTARQEHFPPFVSAPFKDLVHEQNPVVTVISPWVGISPMPGQPFLSLNLSPCAQKQVTGIVFWRFNDRTSFTITDEHRFTIEANADSRCMIRLPEPPVQATSIQFRIDFSPPVEVSCIDQIALQRVPCK